MDTADQVLADFSRVVEEYVSRGEFEGLLRSGRPLRIKYGVDVTAPHLHIGHAVNLWAMRRLQDLGHTVVFLIGDFTTRIGDPTGRNRLRPVVPPGEIEANAALFIEQARMVLRWEPEVLEVRRNSEWYDAMPAGELLRLLSMVTHARLASRDAFGARIARGEELHMHEMIYPVLQGYDSVAVRSDLTVIGSDQLFNEGLGRFYAERFGLSPQVIVTTRITPGIDGRAKQSKSLGNYIGLGHSPRDKFGRAMRVPDRLIADYLTVYTDLPLDRVEAVRAGIDRDPMAAKLFMARAIVARYHGEEVAEREERWFRQVISGRNAPPDMPEVALPPGGHTPLDLLRRCLGPDPSTNDLRRLLRGGAVRLDGEALREGGPALEVRDGAVLQVGRRGWYRLRVG